MIKVEKKYSKGFNKHRKAYFNHLFRCQCDEIDEYAAFLGISLLYGLAGSHELKLVIADSPLACQVKANEIATEQYDTISGAPVRKFFPFCSFPSGLAFETLAIADTFKKACNPNDFDLLIFTTLLKSGIFMALFLPDHAIVCRRPRLVCLDRLGRLHNDKGPAVAWRDGFELFFLDGIPA